MNDTTSELQTLDCSDFNYEQVQRILKWHSAILAAQRQRWEVAARKDEANNWNQALATAVYDEYSTGVPQSEPNKWLVEWANKRIAALDGELGKEQ